LRGKESANDRRSLERRQRGLEQPRRRGPRQGGEEADLADPDQRHKVAAGPDNPQFIVETEKGKRAAHKPAALTKD
jgi:DUF2945 family protein